MLSTGEARAQLPRALALKEISPRAIPEGVPDPAFGGNQDPTPPQEHTHRRSLRSAYAARNAPSP